MMPRRSMRSFRTFLTAKDKQEKEKLHSHFNPLRKRLKLGTIMIGKVARTVARPEGSRLNAVLFKLLVEFSAPILFCTGAPTNAQVQIVKHRQPALAASHLGI